MKIYRDPLIETISADSLVLGDCLKIMPKIPDGSVDMILADLPYGTTNCPWDDIIPLPELWKEYHRMAKNNAAILLFGTQPFTSHLIMSNPKCFKYCWYWEKEKGTGFLNSKSQPMRTIEEICVFYLKKPTYNPQMVELETPRKRSLPKKKSDVYQHVRTTKENGKREHVIYTHSFPRNIIKVPRDKGNRSLISTQKPIALIDYLVRTYSNPNDVILDNVLGSGTTALSCVNLGRKIIGIESDPKHFEICLSRLCLN